MLDYVTSVLRKEVSVNTKKRRLLRAACITWLAVLVVFTIKNSLAGTPDSSLELLVNGITAIVIAFIFFLDLRGFEKAARYLVTLALTFSIINSAFFLFPGKNIELFLLIIGPFSVFFIERSWVQVVFFSVAFGSFLFLPDLLNIHSDVSDIFNLKIVFITVFVIVKDVDGVNRKTEKSLQDQKTKAEKDRELIQLQKEKLNELNEFKNRFFVNVAHELRTPLTLIGGFAEQLDTRESSKFSKGILSQSEKIKQIVNDILDLSKVKTHTLSLAKRTTDLNELIKKIHQSFNHSFQEKGLELVSMLNQEPVKAEIDVIYFERALNNLFLNALKFTPSGRVTISTEIKNEEAIISIKDSGIGIKEEDLTNIFQEYYQVDNDTNRAGGTGIGLSFSKSIVELHLGKINVTSTINEGTCFKIHLPVSSRNESLDNLEVGQIETAPLHETYTKEDQEYTVLLVEDHKEMRDYVASVLKGYKIIQAENGLDALDILESKTVDFILTDYMMPRMDGHEFVKQVKMKNENIPIIVLTARADVEAKLNMLRLGVDDLVVKPFNAEELLIRIGNALKNNKERISFINQETQELEEVANAFVSELSEFINENCSNYDFSLETIKEEFALSTSTLYRRVKSETGLSPIELVKEVRLQKARKAFEKDKTLSPKHLSLLVGISNTSYFKNLYKERFGYSI